MEGLFTRRGCRATRWQSQWTCRHRQSDRRGTLTRRDTAPWLLGKCPLNKWIECCCARHRGEREKGMPCFPEIPLRKGVKVLVAQSGPVFVTSWTAAHQAPLSMELSRQEYEVGVGGEQDGGGLGGRGVHLSPRIHQEYTFRRGSACRTPAESGQWKRTYRPTQNSVG